MDATRMNTVSELGTREVLLRLGISTGKAITVLPPRGPPVEDRVELSPTGIALSRADVPPRPPAAQMDEIRAEIKAGTFVTQERIDGTVERLLEILG